MNPGKFIDGSYLSNSKLAFILYIVTNSVIKAFPEQLIKIHSLKNIIIIEKVLA